jgi:hypothetical protein
MSKPGIVAVDDDPVAAAAIVRGWRMPAYVVHRCLATV